MQDKDTELVGWQGFTGLFMDNAAWHTAAAKMRARALGCLAWGQPFYAAHQSPQAPGTSSSLVEHGECDKSDKKYKIARASYKKMIKRGEKSLYSSV